METNMNYNNTIVAAVNLDIDYARMTTELFAAIDPKKCHTFILPLDETVTEEVTGWSIPLRKSPQRAGGYFTEAREADYNSWTWDDTINVPYTRSVIESLPFTTLGPCGVAFLPGQIVEHTDWPDATDYKHALALSIIPNTAGVGCTVWIEGKQEFVTVTGNAMLLNDGYTHKVAQGEGTRITMRVYGDIDYSWFADKIDPTQCYVAN